MILRAKKNREYGELPKYDCLQAPLNPAAYHWQETANMKPRLAWHKTLPGRAACFLGSIKPAIPVLLGLAAALAYGTYLESTVSANYAKHMVYGSWWFIALLLYTCLALIFAVVVRYPWVRKHTGFIIVHAGLVTTIVGGFISLFGRVEGLMTLQEGMSASAIEDNNHRQLEILKVPQTTPVRVALIDLPDHLMSDEDVEFPVEDLKVRILDQWENSRAESIVLDDAARPLEAIEVATRADADRGSWIGESSPDSPGATFGGMHLVILPANTKWEPPAVGKNDESASAGGQDKFPLSAESNELVREVHFTSSDGTRIRVSAVGQQLTSDWRVADLRFFQRATVGGDGLVEGSDRDNPAVIIVLENTKDGSIERQISFSLYPDMKIAKLLKGETTSGLSLEFRQTGTPADHNDNPHDATADPNNRLVFQNNFGTFKGTWIREDGSVKVFDLSGEPPYTLNLDGRNIFILNHFARARPAQKFIEAPATGADLPVLIAEVSEGYSSRTIQIPWKSMSPYTPEGGGRPVLFKYGPKSTPVPFTIELLDFRKKDYPGSAMAMAYESDVLWHPNPLTEGGSSSAAPEPKKVKIWMNNPLKHDGWKVYQSGFQGDDISTFSIMKDPGLPLTYFGCIVFCSGILVIFYSRNYSHGHPGISKTSSGKSKSIDHIESKVSSRPDVLVIDPESTKNTKEVAACLST